MRLKGIRKTPAQTWLGRFLVTPELQYQTTLRSIDNIEAGCQPGDGNQTDDQTEATTEEFGIEINLRHTRAIATTIAAAPFFAKHAVQLLIEITP